MSDDCNINHHAHREVIEGTVTPALIQRPGIPDTYILTESLGIITGLAAAEQNFIDKQPPGTKVGLVREMFAFDPDRIGTDPGPDPEPTGVSDHLVSFVQFLAGETPVQYERATEHSALWWENPELVGIFQDLLDRWESNDIPDDTALMYAFSEALDARTTTDPSTND